MNNAHEKLWLFDQVEVGQDGITTEVTLTRENIAEYALVSQSEDDSSLSGTSVMPTMILSYAPLMRETIANKHGYTALEQSNTARRQTPFTKCEIRWFSQVSEGDILTATREVVHKYSRRGSNFVTFRVSAINQNGDRVGEYDYTCIFDYATKKQLRSKQKTSHRDRAVTQHIASLQFQETQDSMDRKDAYKLVGERGIGSNIHTDEKFAKSSIFGGTVNSGPATMAYVDQTLRKYFSASAFYEGGRLLMRAITPFRSGDTVRFDAMGNLESEKFDCKVIGRNQKMELVCLAEATLQNYLN